ncbi:MAG: hypothetical protein MRY23_01850 [Pelagibacteraceae bacterium]|nr:hypothetical protein [Pelagibacteraceae bacterium]MCI5079670.1 hypothetical protein [Pelagibacteraceae bacterium]
MDILLVFLKMFKIKIVTDKNEKELRFNEEGLLKFVSHNVIHQAKTMGHATVNLSNERWHIQYCPDGDTMTDCQAE